MIKTSIRNLHSDKDIPPRFCNVIVNGDDVTLEVKINKISLKRFLGKTCNTK